MRKLILTTFLITTFFISKAQVYFSASAGISISNFNTKQGGAAQGFKSNTGYIFSADVNIPLSSNLLFQTGLQYETYRTKINSVISFENLTLEFKESVSGNVHVEYMNMPFKLFYKIKSGNNHFIMGGGPFIGFAVSGHTKVTTIEEVTQNGSPVSVNATYTDQPVRFGSGDGEIKKINAAIGFNLSYQLQSNICFSLYSNLGLTNLNNEPGLTSKVSSAGITVGYIFRKSNKK